jgi:flagellin-like protein
MRKGISEIISSVLLLAIAVSIAGVYSQWAPEFSKETTQEIADQSQNQIKCSNAAFEMSEVQYDITGQISTLKLSNKGTINFYKDIGVTAINSSEIIGRTTIQDLEVEETQLIELQTEKIPETIIAISNECSELRIIEKNIDVRK